jgi:hypothetical protein
MGVNDVLVLLDESDNVFKRDNIVPRTKEHVLKTLIGRPHEDDSRVTGARQRHTSSGHACVE